MHGPSPEMLKIIDEVCEEVGDANSPLRSSGACRSGPLSVLGRSRESVSHIRVCLATSCSVLQV
jgi:hypothetical protein